VAARPRDKWRRAILAYLEAELDGGGEPTHIAVRRTAGPDATAPVSRRDTPAEIVRVNPSPLTERERQVLELVNVGATQAQMARELFVSLNTVKTHLRSIRQKLGVERTGEAAAIARGAGWLEP
jgi:DNA-binding CsgD family transcriptional regulator